MEFLIFYFSLALIEWTTIAISIVSGMNPEPNEEHYWEISTIKANIRLMAGFVFLLSSMFFLNIHFDPTLWGEHIILAWLSGGVILDGIKTALRETSFNQNTEKGSY